MTAAGALLENLGRTDESLRAAQIAPPAAGLVRRQRISRKR